MSVEENKAVVRRIIDELWNKGDFSVVPELISPDFIYHIPVGELKGHDGFIQWVTIWRTACPDFHMTVDEMVGEGDTVVARLSWTGTFTGKFMDYEPTGNKIYMTEAWFMRFKDGKELGPVPFANLRSLFQQMGINPTD